MKTLFQWLDQHPGAYWIGAGLATVALLAAVIHTWRRPGTAPRRDWVFAALLLLFLLAWRWPYLLAAAEYNPDESQFVAGAMTLVQDPVFWRSVDGGTAGPLDFYALLPLHWVGFPLDYFSARLTALLLSWAALLACLRIFRTETPSAPAGLLVLPAAVFFAAGTEPNFVHYSSHHLSLLLVALAVHWRDRRPWTAAVVAGLLPWAKLQTAPLAAVLVGWQCWRIWTGPAVASEKARRSAAVLAAAALPSLLALGLLAAAGQLEHFYRSYLLQSFIYVDGSLPRSVAMRQMWDFARETGHLPVWLGSIALLLAAAGLLRRPARSSGDLGGLALLLTAAAAFCIYAPGRASLHYALLLVLPLTLVLGALLGGGPAATLGRRTTAGLLLVALLPLGWRARQPGPEMFGQFAEDWRRPYSMMGSLLRAYRDTAGSLALWGWHNSAYVEAGLPQGTRDTASAWSIFETRQRDYYRARYLADLERNRPGLFVDAVGPGAPFFPDRRTQAHETFPALAEYVRTHYRLVSDLWHARIYVRNDVLAQHAYTKTDLQRFIARGRPPRDTETPPDRVMPADAASDEIGGRVVRMILPPAELTWRLEGVEREVEIDYGFHPKAYTEGRSNGAWFIVELRAPGQPPQGLFRRLLDPARQSADRRELRTRFPLPPFPPGASLIVRTEAGEFGDTAWDWVYLARLKFLRLPFYAASQFPGFARRPDDADAPQSGIINQGVEQRLMLPSPARLTYVLDGTERRLECVLGFQPGAYENGGQTNGVILRAELRRAGQPAAILFERRFDPAGVPADRGPQPVGFALGSVQPGDRLDLVIDPAGNNSWDWTWLAGLSLR